MDMPFKIGWNGRTVKDFDPTRVIYLSDAILSQNLYGSLVEFNNDGQLVPDLVASFKWTNDEIEFLFDQNSKTNNGINIGPDDAAFSIKKLMMNSESTHGDLKRFICPNQKIYSPFNDCVGIRVNENRLFIKPIESRFGKFLLPLLASPEARIIPIKSFDNNSGQISDFKITSGAYYVDSFDGNGNMTVKANIGSKKYSTDMPQTVQFINIQGSTAYDMLSKNEIDLIPSLYTMRDKDISELLSTGKFDLFATLPIRIELIVFSQKAQSDFSPEQRLLIGNSLKEIYLDPEYNNYGEEPAYEFFQQFSEGKLSAQQLGEIKYFRDSAPNTEWPRKPKIGLLKKNEQYWGDFFTTNQQFEKAPIEKMFFSLSESERPDTFRADTDTGFGEDISLLTYHFKMGTFGMSESDAYIWLENYIDEDDKVERLKMLQALHYKVLKECRFYPLVVSPYTTIFSNEWKANFSRYYAGTNLWQMRIK